MVIWSQIVFAAVTAVSLPPYLLIITICVREWKQNHLLRTFYLLVISQGVLDIIVVANYLLFWTARIYGIGSSIFWNYQHEYVAAWCFTQTYISVIFRCFGILIITLQRYISMCKNGKQIEQLVNVSHRWTLPVLHWTIPTLFSVPLFVITDATFLSEDNLEVLAEKSDITLATSMTASFVLMSFMLCSFCYGAVLRFLITNRFSKNLSVKREGRLYVQMLGLFVAFALLVIYNIMQCNFSLSSNSGPVFTMRTIFPLISGFLSYVNVWMTLFLNSDIRRKVFRLVSCGRLHRSQSIAPVSTMPSSGVDVITRYFGIRWSK